VLQGPEKPKSGPPQKDGPYNSKNTGEKGQCEGGWRKVMLSVPHMIVVFLVVLVVFGPQKLPELARSLGKLMAEFRKASTDFKSAFEEEMRDLERQARLAELRKQAADALTAATTAEAAAANAQSGQAARTPPYAKPTPPASGIEELPLPFSAEKPLTDGPVITPVAEAVARTEEGSNEARGNEAGSKEDAASESTASDGANGESASKESVAATESTPSHDEQQPA